VSGGGRPHVAPLVAQRHLEQVGQGRLVIDDEDPDRLAIGTAQLGRAGLRGHHVIILSAPTLAALSAPCE
jgi:hypothetical protein